MLDLERAIYAHRRHMLYVARSILRDQAASEDAVQDACRAAVERQDRYDPARGSVKAWLLQLTIGCSLEIRRQTTQKQHLNYQLVRDHAEIAEPAFDLSNDVTLRVQQIKQLATGDERDILALILDEGLSQVEAADRLGVHKQTVNRRLAGLFARVRAVYSAQEADNN